MYRVTVEPSGLQIPCETYPEAMRECAKHLAPGVTVVVSKTAEYYIDCPYQRPWMPDTRRIFEVGQ